LFKLPDTSNGQAHDGGNFGERPDGWIGHVFGKTRPVLPSAGLHLRRQEKKRRINFRTMGAKFTRW
jgi:hypothetical protein